MFTEQQICRALDGTFTRVLPSGVVVTRKVAKDYIPSYEPPKEQKQASSMKGKTRGPYRPWTDEDDQTLIELRKMRVTQQSCARMLHRCIKIVRARIHHLASIGRI